MSPGDILPTDKADTYFVILAISQNADFPFAIVHAISTLPEVFGNVIDVIETKTKQVYGIPYVDFIHLSQLTTRPVVDGLTPEMLQVLCSTDGLEKLILSLFTQYWQKWQATRSA